MGQVHWQKASSPRCRTGVRVVPWDGMTSRIANTAPPTSESIVRSHTRKSARGSRHGDKQVRGEDTPAYLILAEHGLLNTSYRLESSEEIDAIPGNATRSANL